MDRETADTIKHREIWFRGPHEDSNQARTATLLLLDIEGIIHVAPTNETQLQVSYDLTMISLQLIEEVLAEFGFHLDNNLLIKLKRALWHYSEEIEQTQLGCKRGRGNCTQAVFINHYRQRPHGCRDERPEHWRHYL